VRHEQAPARSPRRRSARTLSRSAIRSESPGPSSSTTSWSRTCANWRMS
jgi:hypothetical protein